MSSRKPNRRSSIYVDKDGRWHGYVTVGVKADGRPDRRHVRGGTEAQVTDKVRELETKRDAGKTTRAGKSPTVAEWMSTYLHSIAARTLKPRTFDDYLSKSQLWIQPNLGAHRLDRLQPEHVDALYAAMHQAGKSPATILKVHRILSRALEVAVRREKVARNVCKLVDPPKVTESEIEPLTLAETRRLLDTAATRRNSARWATALALGLRQGETLGLKWSRLDLDGANAHIFEQLQRSRWRHGCDDHHACGAARHRAACPKRCTKHRHTSECIPGCAKRRHLSCPKPCPKDCTGHAAWCPDRTGGVAFQPPKGKSRRTIPLPTGLVQILRAHRAEQDRERQAAGAHWREMDLVFCQEDGRPLNRSDDWRAWKNLLAEAGLRHVRLHDTRHTAGTLMIEHGVHTRTVQETLGHSRITVTERYTHVASPMARAAADRMGGALFGP